MLSCGTWPGVSLIASLVLPAITFYIATYVIPRFFSFSLPSRLSPAAVPVGPPCFSRVDFANKHP